MAAADVVLVASGTATLEAALLQRPMVITYRMPRLSWWIMNSRRYQPWVGLPNILAGEFVVPELLQDAATAESLSDAVIELLNDGEKRKAIEQRFARMSGELRHDAANRAAEAVLRKLIDASGKILYDAYTSREPVQNLLDEAEKCIFDIADGPGGAEIATLEHLLQETYARLTPWQKTQVARHASRPHFSDYVRLLVEDFTPLADAGAPRDRVHVLGNVLGPIFVYAMSLIAVSMASTEPTPS